MFDFSDRQIFWAGTEHLKKYRPVILFCGNSQPQAQPLRVRYVIIYVNTAASFELVAE